MSSIRTFNLLRAHACGAFALAIVLSGGLLVSGQAMGAFCVNPAPVAAPKGQSPKHQCDQCDAGTKPGCSGSPCHLGSGSYLASVTDLTLPTAGLPLFVSRSYESGLPVDGAFGLGWRSNLISRVHFGTFATSTSTTESLAIVTLPAGGTNTFIQRPDGGFDPEDEGADLLERHSDGSFLLTTRPSGSRFAFDVEGRLRSISDDLGRSLTYTYDTSGRLERVSDDSGSGRYVEVFYGADGRIGTVRDSSGRQVSYTYNPGDGSLQSVTDLAGRVTQFGYGPGRFSQVLTGITDAWGRAITTVTYDAIGRVKTYTEAGETFTYSYLYGDLLHVSKTDTAGNRWLYALDEKGLVTARQHPIGTEYTTFDPAGRVLEHQDVMSSQTRYTYGPEGQLTSVWKPGGTGIVRYDYTYDPAFPTKVSSVTPRIPVLETVVTSRQAWQYEYWPEGSASPGSLKVVKRVRADGTPEPLTMYEYDAKGRVTKQTSGGGAQTDYAYDAQGNLWTVTGPANNDAGTRPVTTYAYDALGRVLSVTDPLSRVTSYTYDALGRVLTVTLPKPSAGSPLTFTTTYTYDNWDAAAGLVFTHVTDPNGRVSKLGYDQFGRLVKSIDAAANVTTYGYTKDLLTSITDANGNVTQYDYDTMRRLKTTTFPDGATEGYTYRADGLLATKRDRRGTTVTYDYDADKRVWNKVYSTGGSVKSTYEGQLLMRVIDTTVSPSETHDFTYDFSYRLATSTQSTRGTLIYGYGPDDRIATIDLPGGVSVTYDYYGDGSLKTAEWTPVAGLFRWDYSMTGQYQQVTFPNGQARSYSYDDQGRLLQIGNALGATNLGTFAYGYDVDHTTGASTMLGQRSGLTVNAPALGLTGALTKYYYDPLYQLKQADYPAAAPFNGTAEAWTYDAIGNRLTAVAGASTRTYTYFKNGANTQNGQRLQNDGDAGWTYDTAGNAATRQGSAGSFTFGYDSSNRMTSISGAATASYTYDYQGRRTSKTEGGVTTTYLYDGLNLLSETTNGVTTYFLNGPGIDEPLAMVKNSAVSYFSVDGLGSVVATNDPSGTVTHSVVSDAWGNVKAEAGTRSHPFTYTGREIGEAGFHFYRARFYQPGIGRFSQEDPIGGRAHHMSLYAYVGNAPIVYADPTGMVREPGGCDPNCCTERAFREVAETWAFVNRLRTYLDVRWTLGRACRGYDCNQSASRLQGLIEDNVAPKCWISSFQLTKGPGWSPIKKLTGKDWSVHYVVKFTPCPGTGPLSPQFFDAYTVKPRTGPLYPDDELDETKANF